MLTGLLSEDVSDRQNPTLVALGWRAPRAAGPRAAPSEGPGPDRARLDGVLCWRNGSVESGFCPHNLSLV